MSTPSADGAEAAARYFIDLHSYAYVTGDTAPLRAMADAACAFCTGAVESVEGMRALGRTRPATDVKVQVAQGAEIKPSDSYAAFLRVVEAPADEVDQRGNVYVAGQGGTYDMEFALRWADGWVVRQVDLRAVDGSTP